MAQTPAPQLLEVSWEVCNKVGGIYTVITSKLAQALKEFPEHYLAIGPYLGQSAHNSSFHEEKLPVALQDMASTLQRQGVTLHYGTWLIPGHPPVVLLDWKGMVDGLDRLKARYWEEFQLDTLGTDFFDVDTPLLWSTAVGLFAQAYAKRYNGQVILQLHEWMSGGALLAIKDATLHTVFTTHATVLGRALSSKDVPIYNQLNQIKPDEEAKNLGVITKHQLEKLAATKATIFTTVSQITAEEATAFLGRKPDFVTQNGLDTDEFPTFDELVERRRRVRQGLHDFVAAYFFPSYEFDLEQTVYHFTMGRYELHNKGYDLFLQALGRLNEQLKQQNSSKTVVALFLVPGDHLGVRPEVHSQLINYRHISRHLSDLVYDQQNHLYALLCDARRNLSREGLSMSVPQELIDHIHPLLVRLGENAAAPSLSPILLRQGDQDAIVQTAQQCGLHNTAEDRVKVLFFPIYFDGFDSIFNLPIYDLITGCDLGVFPSFYEPWGYTPMESLVMGIPAITSNLAGFGDAVTEPHKKRAPGIFVLDRRSLPEEDVLAQLTSYLATSLQESPRQWLERRISAYQSIQTYSWKNLYTYYQRAYLPHPS